MLIEILKALILGLVEGITEWLPISSTGHMILLEEFIQLKTSDEFKEMFFVVVQLGAILAVVFLYFNKLNPLAPSKSIEKESNHVHLVQGCIGVIPAGVVGFCLTTGLMSAYTTILQLP